MRITIKTGIEPETSLSIIDFFRVTVSKVKDKTHSTQKNTNDLKVNNIAKNQSPVNTSSCKINNLGKNLINGGIPIKEKRVRSKSIKFTLEILLNISANFVWVFLATSQKIYKVNKYSVK